MVLIFSLCLLVNMTRMCYLSEMDKLGRETVGNNTFLEKNSSLCTRTLQTSKSEKVLSENTRGDFKLKFIHHKFTFWVVSRCCNTK